MSVSPIFFVALFPIFFAILWLGITSLLGLLSGWYALQERFPDRDEPELLKLGWQSGFMGMGVNLRNCLTLTACPSGLRCKISPLLGPFMKPFLTPWSEIRTEPKKALFGRLAVLRFGDPEAGKLTIGEETWAQLAAASGRINVPAA